MKTLFILSLISLLSACRSNGYKSDSSVISIMAFNVENLFDTKDDLGKNDETYLPLSQKQSVAHKEKCNKMKNKYYRKSCLELDWNEKILKLKMERVAQVILENTGGRGPDILILEEVENLNVLENLRVNELRAAQYKPVLFIDGPDKRGIDVAILTRLESVAPVKLHSVDLKPLAKMLKIKKVRPTRGILQAQLKLPDSKTLNVFAVHFPSQGSPTLARRQAILALKGVLKTLPEKSLAIAGGDFNISAKEEKREQLYGQTLAEDWFVSHLEGCKGCAGTHMYRGKWSFLDALLFSRNMNGQGGWKFIPQSIRVAQQSVLQVSEKGSPARFSHKNPKMGVSDHFPIFAEITPNP